ncbi:MAG: hypothetical protein JWP31_236 [Aeromicrobium sp.]|nr:hypothetical protein [Aeromicrobium sp.]
MTSHRRVATLGVSTVVFVVGGLTGVKLVTQGTDPVEAAPTCEPTTVPAGAKLNSNDVKVNVFNASERSGLANRVTIDLQANGFQGGAIGNNESTTAPDRVAILTKDRRDPRVRLVAEQFRDKVTYAEPDVTVGDGVVVIVGDDYRGLRREAATAVRTDRDLPVCTPVVQVP